MWHSDWQRARETAMEELKIAAAGIAISIHSPARVGTGARYDKALICLAM
jgi:hypothetical protein